MTHYSISGLLRREPLAGFALAAGLIFGLYALIPAQQPQDTAITVTPQAVQAIVDERELVLGRSLQPRERDAVVERFIDEEVLVREAYAQGLDRVDGKVRHQLIRKMTFLLEEEPGEPSPADLEALYVADPERYRMPARVDLQQVLLGEEADAAERLAALREGRIASEDAGSTQTLGQMSLRELSAVLDPAVAEALVGQPVGTWNGPYTQPQGRVLLQVTGSQPAREISPELLQRYLREDWMQARRMEMFARKLAGLRQKYSIETPAPEGSLQAAER